MGLNPEAVLFCLCPEYRAPTAGTNSPHAQRGSGCDGREAAAREPRSGVDIAVAEALAIPVGGSCDPGALSWQIIAAQEEMLRKERELEEARKKLAMIRQQQYKFLPSELRDEEQN